MTDERFITECVVYPGQDHAMVTVKTLEQVSLEVSATKVITTYGLNKLVHLLRPQSTQLYPTHNVSRITMHDAYRNLQRPLFAIQMKPEVRGTAPTAFGPNLLSSPASSSSFKFQLTCPFLG